MAYNNVVDTLTLEDIVPQVVDTVLRTNRFATMMLVPAQSYSASIEMLNVDPLSLAAAMERDASAVKAGAASAKVQ